MIVIQLLLTDGVFVCAVVMLVVGLIGWIQDRIAAAPKLDGEG